MSGRPHPRYPEYSVSDAGRVARTFANAPPQVLTPILSKDGYHRIQVTLAGRRRKVFVHTWVAETWRGPRPSPRHQVRHRNTKRADNRADNLLWGTPQDNADDRTRDGNTVRGERHYRAKLTEDNIRSIRAPPANPNKAEVARQYGVSDVLIGLILKRRVWTHV